MLLHLPIVIMATLSPIPVSDGVPVFDIAKECHFEGGEIESFNRCVKDEKDAFAEVQQTWPQIDGPERNSCLVEATVGGFASYIDLQTCLEMARDLAAEKRHPADPHAGAAPGQPGTPVETVGDAHDR